MNPDLLLPAPVSQVKEERGSEGFTPSKPPTQRPVLLLYFLTIISTLSSVCMSLIWGLLEVLLLNFRAVSTPQNPLLSSWFPQIMVVVSHPLPAHL